MAPTSSRSLLIWSIPTLALLLTFWFCRKKRSSPGSDPGGTRKIVKDQSDRDIHCPEPSQENSKNISTSKEKSEITIATLTPKAQYIVSNGVCSSDGNKISLDSCTVVSPKEKVIPSISELPKENTNSSIVRLSKETKGNSQSQIYHDLPELSSMNNVKSIDSFNLETGLCAVFKSSDKINEVDYIGEVDKNNQLVLLTCEESNIVSRNSEDHNFDSFLSNCKSVSDSDSKSVLDATLTHAGTEFEVVKETSNLSLFNNDSKTFFTNNETTVTDKAEEEKVSFNDLHSSRLDQVDIKEHSFNNDAFCDSSSSSEPDENNIKVSEIQRDTEQCSSSYIFERSSGSDTSYHTMARKTSADLSTEKKANESTSSEDSGNKDSVSENDNLEQTLSSLKIEENAKSASRQDNRADIENAGTCERDSANHSPAEVMLTSPVMSNYSDAHSEGSSDSGKGCSEVATPPSRTPASGGSISGDAPSSSVYEFVLPQVLVGRLIGRYGSFVSQVKAKTNTNIFIKKHPESPKLKICAIEGTQVDIDNALEMIREKFPERDYPAVTLEQVCFVQPSPICPIVPEFHQLYLVEGINNDVILSSIVSPSQFFVQQPTHPTFPSLNRLNECMNICYSEADAPLLPTPISAGVICAASTGDGWYRVQVVSVNEEDDTCDIKFVDYGGYVTVQCASLRQIRGDFMTLPFQAAECYLANVCPIEGFEAPWSKEALDCLEEITRGQVLQAQICGYAEDGLPFIYLYLVQGLQVIFINQDLVHRGLAQWYGPTTEI